jgi:hypothetical protein
MKIAAATFAGFVVVGVLVGTRHHDSVYSHANQEEFVRGCEDTGAPVGTCRCMFSWIEHNVSEADYKAYEKAVTSSSASPSQTPAPWMRQAALSCVHPANG